MLLPEYDSLVPETPPSFSAVMGVAPANILVEAPSLEVFGSPPPLVTRVTSPLFLDGIIASSAGAVLVLTTEVAERDATIAAQEVSLSTQGQMIATQQTTIDSLVLQAFGGPVTRVGAEALIAMAKARLAQAEKVVCPGFLPACVDQRIRRARVELGLAQTALAAGNYEEAARHAREAYADADLAERLYR